MSFAGLKQLFIGMGLVLIVALGLIRHGYVESEPFPDRTSMPLLASTEMELVADLPLPPGNIAVTKHGEVFFTFHPEARPTINIAKLVDGQAQAFPSMAWQPGGAEPQAFNEVLSIRVDNQQRLWALDNGKHGLDRVRLLAFDINSGELLQSFTFAREEFSLGSHANDFQISNDGRFIIISDASLFAKQPALIVFDIENESARRVLDQHESVLAGHFEPIVQGRKMTLYGLFTVNPGVDGLVLDQNNEYLYYAAVSADQLYRVPFAALIDKNLTPSQLSLQVEAVGEKTMTDGMAMDAEGNVYLSDLENSSIVRRNPDGTLDTLLKSIDIRWPDGFSNGPNESLYFTCSSLHQVIGMSDDDIAKQGPYQIYRFTPPKTERLE